MTRQPPEVSRRVRANQRNARRSTGPRTKAGKARVAQNAFRHGLARPIAGLPEFDSDITLLTRLLAGADADGARLDRARRVAEAEVDIIRIRRVRLTLEAASMVSPHNLEGTQIKASIIAAAMASGRSETPSSSDLVAPEGRHRPQMRSGEAEPLNVLSKDLARLDRYERRALSRRKSAAKELDDAF